MMFTAAAWLFYTSETLSKDKDVPLQSQETQTPQPNFRVFLKEADVRL